MSEYAYITLLALIVVIILLCELVCWHWKINRNIELLAEIRDELRSMQGKERLPRGSGFIARLQQRRKKTTN